MKITSLSIPISLIAIITTNLPIMAGTLEKWNFDTRTNQLQIKIKDGVKPNYFILSQPPRIVIDLPDTQLGKVSKNQLFNSGQIQQVRLSQFTPEITRIVLELSPDTNLNPDNVKLISQSPNNEQWLIQTKITSKPLNINNSLPPASFDKNLPVTVTVPPLDSNESSTMIPVEKPPESVPPIITVPPVPSPNNSTGKKAKIITFGQPLPPAEKLEIITPKPPESIISPLILSQGSIIKLRYSGDKKMPVKINSELLEIWQLEGDIKDKNNQIIAPSGTIVMGKFTQENNHIIFLTENIKLPSQNMILIAESEPLQQKKNVSSNEVLKNSAFGAIGGVLIGGEIGFFSGAAVGAATTYVITPDSIILQPGQIIQVKLRQDLR